ncbi:hypothetical protein DOM22_15540 [Bdellovibrio sp. ZAP7]|uniref:hypothetical protein n=1 Tax=Bdellovibrio sp. ZAP7 TaxID=2231053 RepID=UPI00115BF0AA|nr:hypothetical protein [Bdellovibrio sp. ZAP7]QDK46476.1 hypothetical protein DOM22_15540 [Bdellovibrio sp. ZAP7]
MSSIKGFKYMRNAIQGLTILAALSFTAPTLAAQSPTTSNTIKAKRPLTTPEEKSWSVDLGLETYSNLMKEEAYERDSATSMEVSAGYRFNKITSMRLTGTLVKENSGAQNTYFDNTIASLSFKTPLTTDTAWINTLAGVLPTNRQLQDETSYQGAVRIGTKLAFNNLFWGSSATTALQATRNFHEYNVTADGGFNIRNNLQGVLTYNLPLFSKLSLQTLFVYTTGWTYLEDTRQKFSVGADLAWEFTPAFSAYIGTSNEGNALKANGIDSNIEFFNDTSSIVKAGLSYSI